mmetsp:Transcript_9368/g.14244  ORF Transcript_9368/g.14244 Transcript_9368/m.14244 type:complete len:113 (-) Transcript_9368:12-350(-)
MKTVVDQRKQEDQEQERIRMKKEADADKELKLAQQRLNQLAFDSKPVKTKKQQKQELEDFPSLEGQEEFISKKQAPEESKTEESKKAEGGATGGRRRKGGKNQGQALKLGFF